METKKTSMRMRPVYVWETEGPPEEFIARLRQLASFDPAVKIQCGTTHAMLSIPVEARHTWSPTLDIHTRPAEVGTRVHARMGPEPPVWTFFMFCYAAVSVLGLIGSIFGLVQLSLGSTAWGLLALPGWALLCGGLYLSSFIGRGLGAEQIHQLLAAIEATLGVDARLLD